MIKNKSDKTNKLTLKSVAKKAGVSPITVSRVINGYAGVRSELREKVESAIATLGYIPNRSASVLASSRSKLIGVVIPSLSNVVFNDVLQGIYNLAVPENYQVLLADSHYSPLEEERSIRTLLSQSPEGLIITGGQQTDNSKAMLKAANIPIVQIMDLVEDPLDMCIGFSHFDAGAAVARALLAQSYSKIGFIGARMDPRTCDRLAGFKSVLLQHDCVNEKRIITDPKPSSIALGATLLQELMAKTEGDCDAVFCCNDDLAMGVLNQCQKMHIPVPEKFGIFGFNDFEMASYTLPALSSVSVNRYEMGEKAMKLIFERINPPSSRDEVSNNPSTINTQFKLMMRDSTR